jgi:DNA polymerase-3 subunit gamma/tau
MRSGFEMALLRMLAFRPDAASGANPEPAAGGTVRSAAAALRGAAAPVTATSAAPMGAPVVAAAAPVPAPATNTAAVAVDPAALVGEWGTLIERMALKGMVRELARHCVLAASAGGHFKLALPPTHSALLTETAQQKLQEALTRVVGAGATLRIEVAAAAGESPAQAAEREAAARLAATRSTLEHDPVVQALAAEFGAKLDPGSVRPRDD